MPAFTNVATLPGSAPAHPTPWRLPLAATLQGSVRHALASSLALATLYALDFSVLSSVLLLRHGFPLDDSYIHQTVARNLALHGTLGFDAQQRSSGATSLLWTLLQALNLRLLHLDPVAYNVALSYLLLVAVGPLLFLMAVRDRLPPLVCWILAASPALLGNFLWLGMIGMEHLLFVDLCLAAIFFWLLPSSPSSPSAGSALLAGLAAGLLSITRPEAIAFGPLLLLATLRLQAIPRSRRDLALFVGPWLVFTAAMLGTSLWTSHSLMPATLHGRRWLYFHTSGGAFTLASKLRFLGSWVQRLPRQFSLAHVHQLGSLWDLRSRSAVLGLLLLALIIIGAIALVRRSPLRIGLLCAWAALHFFLYLFTFPAAGHGGRYQPLTLLLLLPLMLLGVCAIANHLLGNHPPAVLGIVAVTMLLAGVSSLHTWRRVTFVGISHINDTHGQIAQWMNQHLPPNAVFAAFDIGRVSYDWHGTVIDLGGLVDPTYVHFLQTGRVGDYLHQKHVQYVMLPSRGTQDMGLQDVHGTKLVQFCSSPSDWLLGFRYTIHATPCQLLYQLAAPEDSTQPLSSLAPLTPDIPATEK